MLKTFLLICLLCGLSCLPLTGKENEESEGVKVTATGIGHDADEALKDAFKNAIGKAGGVYVISETTMNNEDIDDKVYANSNATISTHTIIDTKTLPSGLVQVTIKAWVKKGSITHTVSDKEKPTDITQQSILNTINSLEAQEEAMKSLDHLFKDFPASILKAKVNGELFIDDSKDTTRDTIPMKQRVHVWLSYKKYENFVESLCKLFDSMGYPKGARGGLTEEIVDLMQKSETFNNCFCMFMFKDPQKILQGLEDITNQVYRLPGQVMRQMGKYPGQKVFLRYELSSDDGTILAIQKVAQPQVFRCGHGIFFNAIWKQGPWDQKKHTYTKTFEGFNFSYQRSSYGKSPPHVAILAPFMGSYWQDSIKGAPTKTKTVKYFDDIELSFRVNRQLFEKAQNQNLKIKVSICNESADSVNQDGQTKSMGQTTTTSPGKQGTRQEDNAQVHAETGRMEGGNAIPQAGSGTLPPEGNKSVAVTSEFAKAIAFNPDISHSQNQAIVQILSSKCDFKYGQRMDKKEVKIEGTSAVVPKGTFLWPRLAHVPFKLKARIKLIYKNNVRILLLGGELIFNWEQNNSELRFDTPEMNDSIPDAGELPVGKWLDIEVLVTQNLMTVKVDNVTRAYFSGVFQPDCFIGLYSYRGGRFGVSDMSVSDVQGESTEDSGQ